MSGPVPVLVPEWPAPPGVSALVTTREGGVSAPPYDTLNLAGHVGDDPVAVRRNRSRLLTRLRGARPTWLHQVHGTDVVRLGVEAPGRTPLAADASWTDQRGVACAVLTADCLPVVLCDRRATVVAAAHCGWRGLCAGILEAVLDVLPVPPDELIAWLGPGISAARYEVGAEVAARFERDWGAAAAVGFTTDLEGRIRCDLAGLARADLIGRGVAEVYGGGMCSFGEGRFYSYRRQGQCGRMATMIWLG